MAARNSSWCSSNISDSVFLLLAPAHAVRCRFVSALRQRLNVIRHTRAGLGGSLPAERRDDNMTFPRVRVHPSRHSLRTAFKFLITTYGGAFFAALCFCPWLLPRAAVPLPLLLPALAATVHSLYRLCLPYWSPVVILLNVSYRHYWTGFSFGSLCVR